MLDQVGGEGWDGIEKLFAPAVMPDRFDPGDTIKKMLAAFYRTAQGRELIEWLADLTVRAPYPHVGTDFQSAAIAAAKHEARFGVGLVLFKALADGEQLFNPKEPAK